MMGGERLDISVRNARSTAAPHKRDLESIVVGAATIVKRYFDRGPNRPPEAGTGLATGSVSVIKSVVKPEV